MRSVFMVMSMFLWLNSAQAAVLKPYLITTKEVITLADIFEDLKQYKEVIVTPAPAPGKKKVFQSAWLKNIARQYNVQWTFSSDEATLTIERKGHLLSTEALEAKLTPLIHARLGLTDGELNLDPFSHQIFALSPEETCLKLTQCHFDSKTQKINVAFTVDADQANTHQTYALTGKMICKVNIPVLNKPVKPGQIITQDDIVLKTITSAQISPQTITAVQGLIGKEPHHRTLFSDTPIASHDLKTQHLVKQGDIVTMVLKIKNMTATAKGKALNNASVGDSVSIANIDTKKIITGIVEQNGCICVQPPAGLAL